MKKKANMLIVTQGENSSHAIAGREMLKFSKRWKGDVITNSDIISKPTNLNDYDLILNYCYEDTGVLDALAPFCCMTIIVIGDGFAFEGEKLEAYQRLPCYFDRVAFVSRPLFDFFNEHDDMPGRQHYYLPHGVDTDLFRHDPYKESNDKYTLGWVGNYDLESKRFDMANELVDMVTDSMLIAPSVEHADMPGYYNGIDCLIVTSDIEAHPLVVYEAMACGIPVITKPVGDVSDTIVSFVNGFIVPMDATADNYASVIAYLRDNPAYAKYVSKASRLTVLQNWSWEQVIHYYDDLAPDLGDEVRYGGYISDKGIAFLPCERVLSPEQQKQWEEIKLGAGEVVISIDGSQLEAINLPKPTKLPIKVRGISWGGNFFLGLVKDSLQELMDYDTYDNKTDDLEDMDVLYVVSPRISRQSLFKQALDRDIRIVWHWIGSDVLSLMQEYDNCNGLPAIYNYKPHLQTHLGVSENLVDELQEMGLKATEMNLVSNWDFGIKPLPDEFTVLVYYPPVECTAYAQDAVQRIVKKCKDIKFILYGMRPGQKLDFKKPKNVTLDYWRDTEDDMAKLYESGSCLLRYNNHDGYPSSIIEAVMMGRQVITNGKFPHTIHVDTEAEVLEHLKDIKGLRVLNVRGSRYYKEHQTRSVYLRGFLELLKEVMG